MEGEAKEVEKLTIEFSLPDSSTKVVMRKPMMREVIAAQKDKSVSEDSFAEQVLCVVSQICTFDGKLVNWHDLAANMSLRDYNVLAGKYTELSSSGK